MRRNDDGSPQTTSNLRVLMTEETSGRELWDVWRVVCSPLLRSISWPLCSKVTVGGGRLCGGRHGIIAVFPIVTFKFRLGMPSSKLSRSETKKEKY